MPRTKKVKRRMSAEMRQRISATMRRRHAEKNHSPAIDADLLAVLNQTIDTLSRKLGFRPTPSQALRFLMRNTRGVN